LFSGVSCYLCRPRLFCLLPLHPPTSTLFPYTTLFRSCPGHRQHGRKGAHAFADRSAGHQAGGVNRTNTGVAETTPAHTSLEILEDRKSTRLNSSHVKISYAVFCLKKKKKKREIIPQQK